MNDEQLKDLRARAEAAKPFSSSDLADQRFIDAASPHVVLELLDERETLRAERDEALGDGVLSQRVCDYLNERDQARAERDHWESVAKDSAFKLTNLMLDADRRTADRIAEYVASTNPGFAQVMLALAANIRAGAWRKP
jgi:hypothetical protein